MEKDIITSGPAEGESSSPGAAGDIKRWSANRKKEGVLRLIRGEPIDSLSRELGVEFCSLEAASQGPPRD
jgi:transposase